MARRYAKSNGVVERQIRGERVLVPIAGSMEQLDSIYALNDVASFICGKAYEGLPDDAIAAAVAGTYRVEFEVAAKDTHRVLGELVSIGALVPVESD